MAESAALKLAIALSPAYKRTADALRRVSDLASRPILRLFGRRGTFAVGLLLMVAGFGQMSPPLKEPFYVVTAEVLPILLLVAVVEGRYFHGVTSRGPFDVFFMRTLLTLPLLGEVAALAVVAQGADSLVLRGAVLTGLGTAGLLFLIYSLFGPARVAREVPRRSTAEGDADGQDS